MKSEQMIIAMRDELVKFSENKQQNYLLDVYISKKTKQGLPAMIRALNWVLEENQE